MNIEKQVTRLVEEKIENRADLFIVDIKIHANGRLIILVDGDNGVSIKDCADISRHVGYHLEEDNVIESAYNLEVSSPGLDFPLQNIRQYQKNINRSLIVKSKDGESSEGKLLRVTDAGIALQETIKEKGKKAQPTENFIPFGNIAESKVTVSFK